MALGTPSWLNTAFMERVLRKSEADDTIQVIDVFTKLATDKGDNYTSEMIRANVELARQQAGRRITEKISVIVKIAPQTEGIHRDLILQIGLFETEMSMLTNTLPKMNKILNIEHPLNARGLFMQKDEPMLLVMEDLAPLGYRMADRQVGLDLTHSIMAIRALGKFHASSVALCEKDPGQKELYHKGMFSEFYPPEMRRFFIEGTKLFAKEIVNWTELDTSIHQKIKDLSEIIYPKGIEAVKCDESEFNVINHGDYWVNNMLFRYDENEKPIGHIFVDFQLCLYSSPAIDLHYFLHTSPSEEVLHTNKKLLLDEYLKVLTNTMKQIGCKTIAPTAEQLERSMKKRNILAVIASITILPVLRMDKSNAVDLSEMLLEDGTINNPGYKSPIYRKAMTKRLPIFEKSGLLNV